MALVSAVASRQYGVVSIRQLRDQGASDDWIEVRMRVGWLIPVHRGVYAVGHAALTIRGRWLAAVLACGDGAVLSHHSAAALWRIRAARPGGVDVTARTTAGIRRQNGVVRHRTRSMRDDEVTEREAISVTTPERTILDLAAHLGLRATERMLDEAARLRLTDAERLAAYAEARRGHHGRGPLRRILASHMLGSTLTRSELEERFLALVRALGVPEPLVNAELLGLTVDFFWPHAGVVVEVDGRESHLTESAFEADRARDALLVANGFRPLRFTWRQVVGEPQVVGDRLRRALDLDRARR